MDTYPHLKRIPSELDGLRAARQRRDDMIRILGVPEARRVEPAEDADRLPVAWAWVFVWIGVVAFIAAGFGLGWLIGHFDAQTLLDLLSPTAAQSREAGWVAISEGL